jgi:thioredoxin reductase
MRKSRFSSISGVDEIVGDDASGVTHVVVRNLQTNVTQRLEAAGYFSAIGHQPNSHLVKHLLDLDASGYVKTHPHGTPRTKVPGLFACGDVMDPVYRQAITAAGTGCMRRSRPLVCSRSGKAASRKPSSDLLFFYVCFFQ